MLYLQKKKHILNTIFNGTNYRFCSHNDIGINRVVGWHKDKLNGKYEKYQVRNIWSEEGIKEHVIIKVLIYLNDHSNNQDGLQLVPGSHKNKEINSAGAIKIYSEIGDIARMALRKSNAGNIAGPDGFR